jgi:hypothetical protein
VRIRMSARNGSLSLRSGPVIFSREEKRSSANFHSGVEAQEREKRERESRLAGGAVWRWRAARTPPAIRGGDGGGGSRQCAGPVSPFWLPPDALSLSLSSRRCLSISLSRPTPQPLVCFCTPSRNATHPRASTLPAAAAECAMRGPPPQPPSVRLGRRRTPAVLMLLLLSAAACAAQPEESHGNWDPDDPGRQPSLFFFKLQTPVAVAVYIFIFVYIRAWVGEIVDGSLYCRVRSRRDYRPSEDWLW